MFSFSDARKAHNRLGWISRTRKMAGTSGNSVNGSYRVHCRILRNYLLLAGISELFCLFSKTQTDTHSRWSKLAIRSFGELSPLLPVCLVLIPFAQQRVSASSQSHADEQRDVHCRAADVHSNSLLTAARTILSLPKSKPLRSQHSFTFAFCGNKVPSPAKTFGTGGWGQFPKGAVCKSGQAEVTQRAQPNQPRSLCL